MPPGTAGGPGVLVGEGAGAGRAGHVAAGGVGLGGVETGGAPESAGQVGPGAELLRRLSSSALGSSDRTGTGVESGRCRSRTVRLSTGWYGSSGAEKVRVTLTLSFGAAWVRRGPMVSRGMIQRMPASVRPAATRVESYASRLSRWVFLFWSMAAYTT